MSSDQNFQKKINILTNKLKVGLFDEVISDSQHLLKKNKDQIIYNILSIAYQGKNDYDSSIKLLEKAIKNNSRNIFFLNNLGLSYFKKNDIINAEKYYKRALEIDPNYINVLVNYANLKKELDLLDEAIIIFQKALGQNNQVLEVHYNLATIYQSIGEYTLAIQHFKKVNEIDPKFTKADRGISSMMKYKKDAEHLLEMQNKITKFKLNKQQSLELHFALGKAYEDLNDYKNSFINLKKANSLKREITNYSVKKDLELFEKIKKFFNKDYNNLITRNETKLIFIVGMPRSGTSLVEQIISSHPEVYGGGERIFLNEIVKDHFFNEKDYDLNNHIEKIKDGQKKYLTDISLLKKDLNIFTDKSPLNFRFIGFIATMFPNSKIIHCKREKLEVCWSNYKNNFEGSLHFSNDFNDLSEYYKLYNDLMGFWMKKFSKNIYEIIYDNLISSPESEIKKLVKSCEINWHPSCLKHNENKRPIRTVSFNQARKPIYKILKKNSDLFYEYLNELRLSLKSK